MNYAVNTKKIRFAKAYMILCLYKTPLNAFFAPESYNLNYIYAQLVLSMVDMEYTCLQI